MKRLLLLSLLVCTGFYAQTNDSIIITELSQKQTDTIKAQFSIYFNSFKNNDWEKAVDRLHPEFMKMMSRNDLLNQMKNAFEGDNFTTTFNSMEIKDVEKTFSYENVRYSIVIYKSSFTFHFTKSQDKTEEEFNEYLDDITSVYTNQFLKQVVTRNMSDITIAGNKEILFIDDPKFETLKVLVYANELSMVYKEIFPEAVANELSLE